MHLLPDLQYPECERPKLALLETLFREWHEHFKQNGSALEKHAADDMVFDGFYPYYFSQGTKVLFIGRESRGLSGCNNMDVLYQAYRETKLIDKRNLDDDKFHSRMLYVTYGIMNGMPEWKQIPFASEIGDTFGSSNGLSFAFMNISKLSNMGEQWQSDWGVLNTVHNLSNQGRSFNKEEVTILEPNVVITMNLGSKLDSLGILTPLDTSDNVNTFWLDNQGHRSLLIDTFHFTAWGKNDIENYYTPICDAIKRHGVLGKA